MAPEIQELILQRASAPQIRAQADALGFATLLADGEEKVRAGITTRQELLRVVSG
jgi:type II secretory ATPase GspE/PulE/Tfp pilus assembly ATPase PilB-like protein